MTPLRQPMLAALQRRGTGERTQASSVRAVRLLAPCSHTAPDRLSAPELQRDVLHRTPIDGLAPASMRLCSSGMRFCSPHGLQRDWPTLALLRAPTLHPLPAVLRVEEVRRLLQAATPLPHQVSFPPVSRVGLRLHAALFLQGAALEGQRLQVQVHRGQGATDRSVPLPADPLTRLRPSWTTHRHPTGLFPATGRHPPHRPPAPSPRRRRRVQGAFRTATQRAGLLKTGGALPPLRHASATQLLEAGGTPRLSQRSLGPPQLATPMVS
jgi:integrase/recombinase XerD